MAEATAHHGVSVAYDKQDRQIVVEIRVSETLLRDVDDDDAIASVVSRDIVTSMRQMMAEADRV